jgi:hypothetical protein
VGGVQRVAAIDYRGGQHVARLAHALGVEGAHGGAILHQAAGDRDAGGIAHVVGFGFEGEAEQGDGFAAHAAAGGGNDARCHAGLAGVVHRDHGLDQAAGGAVILCDTDHGQGVLGEATAAVAGAGMQEFAADAAIETDAAGDIVHVGTHTLAHVGHFVNESDFHGEKGIGRVFDQFGGFERGEQDRRLDQIERAI